MAQSLINPEIRYVPFTPIDPEDKGMNADIYAMHLGRKTVEVALGGQNNQYVDKGIVFYPIYHIEDSKVVSNPGVYELATATEMDVGTVGGQVDVDKLGDPLLFDEGALFARGVEEENVFEEEEEADDVPEVDPERPYIPTSGSPWISKLMSSHDYALMDNEGGGDCLFAVIRDGLGKIGRVLTVAEIRAKLAAEADDETFQNYKSISDAVRVDKSRLSLELATVQKSHKTLEERGKKDLDLATKRNLIVEARKLEAAHTRLLAERKLNMELREEYKFMEGVTNLEQFRAVIQRCEFWADTWAISTLERALNIKLVIFSEEAYAQGDLDNTLLCGQVNDRKIGKDGAFTPDLYIMTSFFQEHYKLVTHRRRGAFTFAELPQDVKELIVRKCMERGAGPYSLIPHFKQFKSAEISEGATDRPQVTFQVYDKSSTAAHPGKGSGENISHGMRAKYALLHKQKDWRRQLSTSWPAPFELDGATWQSVDHYVEAQKFKRTAPTYYIQFTLGSKSKMAESPAMARAAGKSGKFAGKRVLPQGVMPDPTLSPSSLALAREAATKAKFEAHVGLQDILNMTNGARIVHYERGQPARHMVELEGQRA